MDLSADEHSMSLLANKIAEMIDSAISSTDYQGLWRGNLNEQSWKIVVEYDTNANSVHVRAVRRDGGEGVPE